ncbi:hypothetical protein TrispH2_005599 [Trichoplax sp. H2]|nr:hypothetical protein TrispH2_005599 [Trichoplax sp. H2]|eukprot:RDD42529.1 hypothetical protein TrispH2_005599 [Trichoplax sp. H2]
MVNEYDPCYFPFFSLPDKIIYDIFNFLYGTDLAKLCLVSSQFNHWIFARNQLAWKDAIYSELSTNPVLISQESYRDFYKRAYLGLYRCIIDKVSERKKLGMEQKRSSEDTPKCVWRSSFLVEKEYSYGHYLKQEKTQQNSSCIRANLDRQDRLRRYLCTAAKHGYEVWAATLCHQGANICGLYFTLGRIHFDNYEDYFLCPLYFATLENNERMIQKIIELGIRYQSPNPYYILPSNDDSFAEENASGDYVTFSLHFSDLQEMICKVLICINDNAALLEAFLNSLDLPSIHQAAIYQNIDEFSRFLEYSRNFDLNDMDHYNMTPIVYCILLNRKDVVRYIYNSRTDIIVGRRLAESIKTVSSSIPYDMLKIIREHDNKCYKAVVFGIFADEKVFTSDRFKDVLRLILVDLVDEDVFYAAFDGAISSGSNHLINLLILDLFTFLRLYITSITDVQRLFQQITSVRKKVIVNHGETLLWKALRSGHHDCFRLLILKRVSLSKLAEGYSGLHSLWWFSSNVLAILPSNMTVTSNIRYEQFHQFLLQLRNPDLDTNAIAKTLLPYKFVKAIVDLPIYIFLEQSRTIDAWAACNTFIIGIMLYIMLYDWKRPIFADHQLQKRLEKISYTLLENLLSLQIKYFNINTLDSSFGGRATLLHIATQFDNPMWVNLLLQAGANRLIEDSLSKKPIQYVKESDNKCRYLLENYQSCPRP